MSGLPLKLAGNIPLFKQFVIFSAIGSAAFFVDSGILTLLLSTTNLGFYAGRGVSFFCAATFTWFFNRQYTFPKSKDRTRLDEWLWFLGANAIGAIVNLGIYAWAIFSWTIAARHPVIAVAAGSLSGLLFNFMLSKKFVFQSQH